MNRRDFLRGASIASVGLGVDPASAQQKPVDQKKPSAQVRSAVDDELSGRPVKFGVIGLGIRGKEILTALSRIGKFAEVVAICDSFAAPIFVKKAKAIAPNARVETDYRKILDDASIEGVFVATPTHLHKEIVLAAIKAGKHVFCEAPLANTIDDAREIAVSALGYKKIFMPGLHQRCNQQAVHVRGFIQSQAIGKITGGRAHYHERKTWRFGWPTPEREADLNWRLDKKISGGLASEVAMHQLDLVTWNMGKMPSAISGFGAVMEYRDGRTNADTIQCILEFPNNVRYYYDASLTSNYDQVYEVIYGTAGTAVTRDLRAWLFRETDADLLGWEVFARKDALVVGKPENNSGIILGSGIALVGDASKQLALGNQPKDVGVDVTKSALYQACRGFRNSILKGTYVPAKEPTAQRPTPPLVPGAREGFAATVLGLKLAEAVQTNARIELTPDMFVLPANS